MNGCICHEIQKRTGDHFDGCPCHRGAPDDFVTRAFARLKSVLTATETRYGLSPLASEPVEAIPLSAAEIGHSPDELRRRDVKVARRDVRNALLELARHVSVREATDLRLFAAKILDYEGEAAP
jgi:hypothetical protein